MTAGSADETRTLIIGAGPSGLAAALTLARFGHRAHVVERMDRVGGLMHSPSRGPFIIDLGRKELYTRIPEVDRLWRSVLGSDYRLYSHRVGSLYRGRILEMSGRFRGLRRGLPVPWLLEGGVDLLVNWLKSTGSRAVNYEQYFHQRAGRKFARLFAQGYWEKFRGIPWSAMPVPGEVPVTDGSVSYSLSAVREGLRLAAQGGPAYQPEWRHPARGSGQICDLIYREVTRLGGSVHFNAEVQAIHADGGKIVDVKVVQEGRTASYRPRSLISSLQVEDLVRLIAGEPLGSDAAVEGTARSVLLVYLFLDEPPRFPHAWLEVNDPNLECGRITNYAAFGGDMVPTGKTCLCVEFFCTGDSPLLALSESELLRRAVAECIANRLIDPGAIFDSLVLRLERSNAAASWRDWQSDTKLRHLERIRHIPNLYHVNRPGTDWATFAGMLAAQAIAYGDRKEFDRRADPTRRYSQAHQGTTDTSNAPVDAPAPQTL